MPNLDKMTKKELINEVIRREHEKTRQHEEAGATIDKLSRGIVDKERVLQEVKGKRDDLIGLLAHAERELDRLKNGIIDKYIFRKPE